MTTTAPAPQTVLTDDMLERFWERAPVYDRENRFFQEDFEELRDAGYLKIAVPEELGGLGLNLAQAGREQRRLAYYAHSTALAINMHLYWTGLCADLWRAGDTSVEWILREAADNKVFAAGHAERGNDLPVLLSTTTAERVDGGYRFTGHKSFGSLGPVWDYLGMHGMDSSDPENPKVVHAFMPRDSEGYRVEAVWDNVLGQRATRSDDTVLEGVVVTDDHIARVLPPGAGGMDEFVLGMFMWGLSGFANVYYGLAKRAYDMIVERLAQKTSIAMTRPMSYHPEIQHAIAEMWMDLDATEAHIDRLIDDWSNGVDHGPAYGLKVVAAKYRAGHAAFRVVDTALDLAGGFGIFPESGFERLFRDARLGRIHPANEQLAHEFIGKAVQGIDPDEQPRWG